MSNVFFLVSRDYGRAAAQQALPSNKHKLLDIRRPRVFCIPCEPYLTPSLQ